MEQHFIIKRRGGFTLLEMLIVIALIGILVSIGVASYSQAQKKSRDSRRLSDLKAVQSGYEQYYADNSAAYPYLVGTSTSGTTTLVNCPSTIESAGHSYLPAGYPTDPKGSGSYVYTFTCTQDAVTKQVTYCLCATLESGTPNSDASCNYQAATKTSYCVSNLQ